MLNKLFIFAALISFSQFALANKKPVAIIEADIVSGYLPLTVNFDGSDSYDPDGQIVSYAWSFGDGNTGNGAVVNYTFTTKKKDKVKLLVTDNSGKKSEEKISIDILNDTLSPILNLDIPDNFSVNFPTPTITAFYSDATSKVDLNSVIFILDGVDVSENVTKSPGHAVLQFTSVWPLTPGMHSLVVKAADFYGNLTSKTISITNTSTQSLTYYLNGRVLDVEGNPLAGAQVQSIEGPVGSVLLGTTKADGTFSLPYTTGGDYKLLISKVGYLNTFKFKNLIGGLNDVLETVYIDVADSKRTLITATAGGVATNTSGSVGISIPAGSLDADKELYFTEAKTGKTLQIPLPFGSHFTYANNNQPSGTVFSEPADMNIANILGFDPGFEIPVGTTDENLGVWVDSGYKGVVNAEGSRIDFKIAHFSDIDVNLNTKSPTPVAPPIPKKNNTAANPPNKKCECEPGSRINSTSNELHIDYPLPSVMRRGKNIGLTMTYSSQSAFPVPIITVEGLTIPEAKSADKVELFANFGGFEVIKNYVGETSTKKSIFAQQYNLKSPEGYYYGTGAFGYFFRIRALFNDMYYTETPYFGGPGNTEGGYRYQVREPVPLEDYQDGRAIHLNQIYSNFGAGWTVNGLEKLTIQNDGLVIWEDGTGFGTYFTPGAVVPKNNKIQKRVDVNVENLHYSKGFFYGASCSDNEVFRIDSKGRFTTILSKQTNENIELNCPTSVFQSRKGGLYIADSGNRRILYLDKNGKVDEIAGDKKNSGFVNPTFVTEDNVLAVHVIDGNEIKTISPFNKDVLTIVSRESDYFKYDLKKPTQIHYDFYHNLVVLDEERGEIIKFYVNNTQSRVILSGIKGIKNMAFDPIVKRFFLLNNKGEVYQWEGQGNNRTVHLNHAKAKLSKSISAISFSPEVGLVYIDENGLNLTESGSKNAQIQLYISPTGTFSSLQKNNNGSFTKLEVDRTRTDFNSDGLIVSRTFIDGSEYSYIYDENKFITTITIPGGGAYTFDYYGFGKLQKITDPSGKVTSFTYDQNSNLIEIKNPELNSQTFRYDSNHLLVEKTDERGLSTNYEFKLGRVSKVIYEGNRIKDVKNGLIEHLINVPEDRMFTRLTTQQTLNEFTSPNDRTKSYLIDPFGLEAGVVDGNGNRNYVSRDENSNPIQNSTAQGRKEYKTYDSLGRLMKTIDGNGTNTFSYNPFNRKIASIRDNLSRQIGFVYSLATSQLTQVIDRRGKNTFYDYGEDKLLYTVRDNDNHQISYQRDAYGNIIGITDMTGQKTSMTRDLSGNLASQTDPLGNVTNFEYDDMNRVSKIIDAKNGETSFSYIPTGELESVIDARGYTTSFVYNEQTEVSKILNHLNQEVNFTHDLDGNILSKVTKANQNIAFAYDGNNNLLSKDFDSDAVRYVYDADNLLVSMSDNDSVTERTYDVFSRLNSEISNHYPGRVNWVYNELGENNRTTLSVGNETTISVAKTRDENGRLIKSSAYFYGRLVNFEKRLDNLNRVAELKYTNGSSSFINYDFNSRPVDMTTNIPGNYYLDYRYTANGNISLIFEAIGPNSRHNRYNYDELNRLVREESISTRNYVYDAVGNDSGNGGQFNEINQLTEDNNFTYTYDLNGNQTRKTDKVTGGYHSFTWNAENQLKQVKVFKNASLQTFTISYKYDASGRRIERSVSNLADATKSYIRKYVYDGDHIMAVLDGNNEFISGYMYDEGIDEPVVLVTDYDKDGELDALSLVRDRQNSVKLIVNEKKEIVQEVSYSAYGETQILNRGQKNPITNNLFYYTSRELEPEIGIYYYRARYYDPGTGRFLSEDPSSFDGQDVNFYIYAHSNPVLFNDPSGKLSAAGLVCMMGALAYKTIDDTSELLNISEEQKAVQQSINDVNHQITMLKAELDKTDCPYRDLREFALKELLKKKEQYATQMNALSVKFGTTTTKALARRGALTALCLKAFK